MGEVILDEQNIPIDSETGEYVYTDSNGRPFQNQQLDYYTRNHKGGPEYKPSGASRYWPDFHCRNSCGFHTPEDSSVVKCPHCGIELVRYVTQYEVKRPA